MAQQDEVSYPRRIVQIAVQSPDGVGEYPAVLIALADDGTMWRLTDPQAAWQPSAWKRVPPLPQDAPL